MELAIDSVRCDCDGARMGGIDLDTARAGSPEACRMGYTLTFTLPSTPTNDSLFGYPADVQSGSNFNDAYHEGVVTVGGEEIFRGSAYLIAARVGAAETLYEVAVTGGSAAWAKNIALKRFNAIPIEYAGVLTPSAICASWQDEDTPVRFFPVHRDSYEVTNSSVSLLPAERILSTDDYHPFISADSLLRAIFADEGYELRSDFMQSDLFRSLYVSGAYAATDTASQRRRMDFKARRTADASAEADASGRVYCSDAVKVNSLGVFVTTASAEEAEGAFDPNGVFRSDGESICFAPPSSVEAGFEYHIKYVTDYRIASRTRLRGFDEVYLNTGAIFKYTLANPFADRREETLRKGYRYLAAVFSHADGAEYSLRTSEGAVIAQFASRTAYVVMPSDCTRPVLYRKAASETSFSPYYGDWALYDGSVTETGRREVELTVRTDPQTVTPSSPFRFDRMFFQGAEAGMNIVLSRDSWLRPRFSASPGLGAAIEFADVAHVQCTQMELVDALRQMFDLMFLTDERDKAVRIEPRRDFYLRSDPIDWTPKIDFSHCVEITERAADCRRRRTFAYGEADTTVAKFDSAHDTALGSWSVVMRSHSAPEGRLTDRNVLFAPTLSLAGKYANAPSAMIMQVRDRDEEYSTEDMNFTPRIVRYMGMYPLARGERWGFPSEGTGYPLAAFHCGATAAAEPFTLCFEDRDGAEGLHAFYDERIEREQCGHKVSLHLRLTPSDMALLTGADTEHSLQRRLFRLDIGGACGIYTLQRIEGYDPSEPSTRCVFLQENLY